MPGRDGPVILVRLQPEGKKSERLDESHRILSLSFEDNDAKADKLKLVVENLDLRNFDDPLWRKGGNIEASWGYEGNMGPTRQCVIQKVTGFRKLTVEALSKSILMHKDTRARSWKGLKRSQVVEKIAEEWGFDAAHRDIEDTAVAHESIVQVGKWTDAQFVQTLAKKEGFQFYVDWSGFHFHRRRFDQKPRRVLHWYGDPGQGDILEEPEIENDVTVRPGKVTMKGRDPMKRKGFAQSGSNAETKHASLASTVEVIDAPTATTTATSRNLASTITQPTSAKNEAAAKREADGRFLKSSALVVKLKLPIIGDPQLNAKQIVEVRGLGKRLSGNYYVRQVDTSVEPGAFKQTLHCIRNGTAEFGMPRSAGKVNAQKGPEQKKSGTTGAKGAPLVSEQINAPDGTTTTRWKQP